MDRVPLIRRAILVEQPVAAKLGWAALAVVVPMGLRWFVDHGEAGVPFITFFPAIILATVILGWRYGTIAAIASGIIGNRLLREEPILFYVSPHDAFVVFLFAITCAILIWAGESLRRIVRQQEAARLREQALRGELLHRVRNMFAIVQSLAIMTFRHSAPEEFVSKLNKRLLALERANDLLGPDPDRPSDVGKVIAQAIEPFRHDDSFTVEGPAFLIPSDTIIPLSMALHELCTNATKYGALSVPGGKVHIEWDIAAAAESGMALTWRESGGPPAVAPARRGMGTALLRPQRGIREVRPEYTDEGFRCAFLITAANCS